MNRTGWMSITAFFVSIPSIVILIPDTFFTAVGCSSFGLTNLTCTNPAITPLYKLTFSLAVIAGFFSVILVPLALVLAVISIMRLFKEQERDLLWWILQAVSIFVLVVQLFVINKVLSMM